MDLRFLRQFTLATGLVTGAASAATLSAPGTTVTEDFATRPLPADWGAKTVGSAQTPFANASALDAAFIGAFDATSGLDDLATSTTTANTPAATWRGDLGAIQSRTTGTTYAAVVTRVRNHTGATLGAITLALDQGLTVPGTEDLPGFRVFYSTTGMPDSWTHIPTLTGC